MSTSTTDDLQRQLADALKRISQLEGKVEVMRENINANLDGQAKVLHRCTEQLGIRQEFSLKVGIDVARGF